MAFPIRLYTFSKAVNSTGRPGNEAVYFEIDANTNTPISVVNPTVVIHKPDNVSLTGYNYCYVPNWGRYYWVQDWTHEKGLWYASLHVDVLATWRGSIGALSPYVLRAHLNADNTPAWDGTISDSFYPAKANWSFVNNRVANPWVWGNYDSGCYSVGIVAEGGVTTFWIMNITQLNRLLNYLLSNDFANDILDALGIAVSVYPEAKAVIDPLQYIASVTWLPIPTPETTLTGVKVGYGAVPLEVALARPAVPRKIETSFVRPTHPQAAARGAYLNAAPFTRYTLFYPPFGAISLDPSAVAMRGSVDTAVYLDMCYGDGLLEIKVAGQVISRISAKVGFSIQLSQVIAPGYGLLSAAGDVAGIAANALTGNWGGAVSGLASGIKDAIESQIPSVNSVGTMGASNALQGLPGLQAIFATVVDDDVAERGRPLCQSRRIDTLRGYIQCIDVEVNVGCTGAEHDMIKAHMERGFFYE